MAYEVDWRAVGNESKSGDCVALRFGDFPTNSKNQTIIIIDGGFRETGEKLVDFIKAIYKSDKVDLIISTHPDTDHLSGLNPILEELKVGELWMHKPWERQEDIQAYLTEGFITKREFSEAVKKSLTGANDLAKLAKKKGIPIREPFQGRNAFDGCLIVLGPTEEFYNQTLAEIGTSGKQIITSIKEALAQGIKTVTEKVLRWIEEEPDKELLMEPGDDATSPRNNGSVICLAQLDAEIWMFTADAGVPALTTAVDFAESRGFSISKSASRLQVPHHGSKRNVGPTILNRLVGDIVREENDSCRKRMYISAAKDGAPKHPNGRVINALIRRGAKVFATRGANIWSHSDDAPTREDYTPIKPIPFQSRYQDEE